MAVTVVVTLTGPDRVGIVDDLTGALLDVGANVETSRMARLGGAFAVLALVSLPAEGRGALHGAFDALREQGYTVSFTETSQAPAEMPTRMLGYRIEVKGADHEGIIHDIAHRLSALGINIESMETSTSPAPVSGTPLFSMKAVIAVPPTLTQAEWESALSDAGQHANVDASTTCLSGDAERA